MAVPNTGIYYIDALLMGQSWSGNTNTPVTINYAYGQPSTGEASTRELMFEDQLFDVSDSLERAVKTAERTWATYANVGFKLVPPSQIFKVDQPLMIDQTNEGLEDQFAGVTFIYDSTAKLTKVDILIGLEYEGASMSPGGYGYFTTLHEFGHALGLKHPFEEGASLTGIEDSWDYSIMSYTEGQFANLSNLPANPMLYDIAAIQYLYGANLNTYAGDTYHGVTTGMLAYVIWDGGGTDLLDASSYGGDSTLDLQEGYTHVNRVGTTALWMAFGANIENATGGNGSDAISGNALNNVLYGNGGNDNMQGFDGADFLQGNTGLDNMSGGQGNDTIYGGKDNDAIRGGKGDDVINTNMGDDVAFGDLGNDTMQGGQGNDVLYGLDGNDFILGDRGNDTVAGGSGADIFRFEQFDAAIDVIQDFEAAGAGIMDRIQFSPILFASVDDVLNNTIYDLETRTQTIFLQGGGNVLVQNINTAMGADDFLIG